MNLETMLWVALAIAAIGAAQAIVRSLPERTWAAFVKKMKEDWRNGGDDYGPGLN